MKLSSYYEVHVRNRTSLVSVVHFKGSNTFRIKQEQADRTGMKVEFT